jgi:hypothetical protein
VEIDDSRSSDDVMLVGKASEMSWKIIGNVVKLHEEVKRNQKLLLQLKIFFGIIVSTQSQLASSGWIVGLQVSLKRPT